MGVSRGQGLSVGILTGFLMLSSGCVAYTTGTTVTRTDPNDTAGGDLSG